MSKQNKVVSTRTKMARAFKNIPWNKPVNGVAGWSTLIVAAAAAAVTMAYFWNLI